jgi:hypothetical protein
MRLIIARWTSRISIVIAAIMLYFGFYQIESIPDWAPLAFLLLIIISFLGVSRLKCTYCKQALLVGYGSTEVTNFWKCIFGTSDFICPSCKMKFDDRSK